MIQRNSNIMISAAKLMSAAAVFVMLSHEVNSQGEIASRVEAPLWPTFCHMTLFCCKMQ